MAGAELPERAGSVLGARQALRGDAREALGLRLVAAQEVRLIQRPGQPPGRRGRVEHGGHAVAPGHPQGLLDCLQGDLELRQQHIGLTNERLTCRHVLGTRPAVRARDDGDGVLAAVLDADQGDTARSILEAAHATGLHPAGGQGARQLFTERIVADAANQAAPSAQASARRQADLIEGPADPSLTANVDIDPRLLHVAGALGVLPSRPLGRGSLSVSRPASGTAGAPASPLARVVA